MMKFRLYYDKDEETRWLNAMAQEGWALQKYCAGFYRFEPCEKGEYVYQIDFQNHPGAVSPEYRELIEDTGAEIVATWFYWVILRRPASLGEFELYTDTASLIEHYGKIRTMLKAASILEIICIFLELIAACNGFRLGKFFACLLIVLTVPMIHAAAQTTQIIARLKGEENRKTKNVSHSLLLSLGLLLNGVCLAFRHTIPLVSVFQVAALVMILAGAIEILKNTRHG